MTHTDMTNPFSSNPKLADWVPSEQQIQTITAARDIWDLVPEEEGDSTNAYTINALNVQSHLHPEVTDPQQLVDEFVEAIPNGSVVDLQHVMGLQGLPSAKQQVLLAAMKRLKQGAE